MLSLRAHAHGVKQMKIISKEKPASQIKPVRKDSKKAVILLETLSISNIHAPSMSTCAIGQMSKTASAKVAELSLASLHRA
jgi:hypothetical protein